MTGMDRPRAAGAHGRRRLGTAGLTATLALLLAAAPAGAQSFFPAEDTTPVLDEGFSGADLTAWSVVERPVGWGAAWALDTSPPASVSNHWAQHVAESAATVGRDSFLLAGATALGYVNGRLELELSTSEASTRLGAAWNVSLGDGYGYLLSFTDLPTPAQAATRRALWRLEKYVGGSSQTIGQAPVVLTEPVLPTMVQDTVYGIRISFFCGNTRVEVREVHEVAGVAQYTNYETLFEWTDAGSLGAGMVGLYSASRDAVAADSRFDNVTFSSWPDSCSLACGNWSPFSEGWVIGDQTSRDRLGFKLLYEGALHDYMNTNDIVGGTTWGRIDCEAGITDSCDGFRVLVDMPDPDDIATAADRQAQQEKIDRYLEQVASAVKFEKDGTGAFSFVQDYNDPLRADYVDGNPDNPIPIVSSGSTPIAASMMDAYDWYVSLRAGDGAWTQDSLDLCRNWYIILITDGEEQCGGDPCGTGEGADLLRAPPVVVGDPPRDLPPVVVSTIGFSASVTGTSLKCVANQESDFYVASDAAELKESLDRLINNYLVEDRAFVPISVAPPLTSILAGQENDFLVTVPIFQPINGSSVWDGHLHAFKLNASTPYPPRDADGRVDTTSDAWQWDAGLELPLQLRGAGAFRNLYWPSNASGTWQRVSLSLAKTNATRKLEFQALTGGDPRVTDPVVDDIVDFMYFFDDADRPDGYYALGDIWHSQPAIVGGPRNFQYLANNVNDYASFADTYKQRRRVAFAGGNDGILHLFDLGQYSSATQAYTTGTGKELLGVIPRAVIPNLFELAALPGAREQQYMVDGPIVAGDVRIDVDYSGDPGSSDPAAREWRTAVLTSMRGGGRSLLALDVTEPDEVPDSSVDLQPDCLVSGACTYDYPRVMWELTDTSDADNGFTNGVCTEESDCWDLGETWSKPVIVRVAKASDDEMYVAFFGGGRDPQGDHTTGNFFYGVDMETGEIIYKANVNASVPGGVAALDLDDDGFADRVYFGTTGGSLYRLNVSAEAILASSGTEVPPGYRVNNWTLTQLYSFGASIQFYTTPVLVPALFEADGYKWAIAIGSGDRSTLDQESTVVERFYFVLDYPLADGTTPLRDETNLQVIAYDAAVAPAGTTYFDPNNLTSPKFGWTLVLREGEKVSADAIVANERVQFPTFVRTAFDPDDPPTVEDEDGNEIVVCQASGIGRLYDVLYQNANPSGEGPGGDERGGDLGGGLIVGGTDYTVGDQTIALWTTMDGIQQEVVMLGFRFHRVTNWRQE